MAEMTPEIVPHNEETPDKLATAFRNLAETHPIFVLRALNIHPQNLKRLAEDLESDKSVVFECLAETYYQKNRQEDPDIPPDQESSARNVVSNVQANPKLIERIIDNEDVRTWLRNSRYYKDKVLDIQVAGVATKDDSNANQERIRSQKHQLLIFELGAAVVMLANTQQQNNIPASKIPTQIQPNKSLSTPTNYAA